MAGFIPLRAGRLRLGAAARRRVRPRGGPPRRGTANLRRVGPRLAAMERATGAAAAAVAGHDAVHQAASASFLVERARTVALRAPLGLQRGARQALCHCAAGRRNRLRSVCLGSVDRAPAGIPFRSLVHRPGELRDPRSNRRRERAPARDPGALERVGPDKLGGTFGGARTRRRNVRPRRPREQGRPVPVPIAPVRRQRPPPRSRVRGSRVGHWAIGQNLVHAVAGMDGDDHVSGADFFELVERPLGRWLRRHPRHIIRARSNKFLLFHAPLSPGAKASASRGQASLVIDAGPAPGRAPRPLRTARPTRRRPRSLRLAPLCRLGAVADQGPGQQPEFHHRLGLGPPRRTRRQRRRGLLHRRLGRPARDSHPVHRLCRRCRARYEQLAGQRRQKPVRLGHPRDPRARAPLPRLPPATEPGCRARGAGIPGGPRAPAGVVPPRGGRAAGAHLRARGDAAARKGAAGDDADRGAGHLDAAEGGGGRVYGGHGMPYAVKLRGGIQNIGNRRAAFAGGNSLDHGCVSLKNAVYQFTDLQMPHCQRAARGIDTSSRKPKTETPSNNASPRTPSGSRRRRVPPRRLFAPLPRQRRQRRRPQRARRHPHEPPRRRAHGAREAGGERRRGLQAAAGDLGKRAGALRELRGGVRRAARGGRARLVERGEVLERREADGRFELLRRGGFPRVVHAHGPDPARGEGFGEEVAVRGGGHRGEGGSAGGLVREGGGGGAGAGGQVGGFGGREAGAGGDHPAGGAGGTGGRVDGEAALQRGQPGGGQGIVVEVHVFDVFELSDGGRRAGLGRDVLGPLCLEHGGRGVGALRERPPVRLGRSTSQCQRIGEFVLVDLGRIVRLARLDRPGVLMGHPGRGANIAPLGLCRRLLPSPALRFLRSDPKFDHKCAEEDGGEVDVHGCGPEEPAERAKGPVPERGGAAEVEPSEELRERVDARGVGGRHGAARGRDSVFGRVAAVHSASARSVPAPPLLASIVDVSTSDKALIRATGLLFALL